MTNLDVALAGRDVTTELVDSRRFLAPWEEIQRRTAESILPGDAVFGRIFEGSLADLFDGLQFPASKDADVLVIFGPGSALLEHDQLWYADLPQRDSLATVRHGAAGNLGQPAGEAGSERRLLFVDWPVLERHKQSLLPQLDLYVDLSDREMPRSVAGETLRRSLHELAGRALPYASDLPPGTLGRPVAPQCARDLHRCPQPRVVL